MFEKRSLNEVCSLNSKILKLFLFTLLLQFCLLTTISSKPQEKKKSKGSKNTKKSIADVDDDNLVNQNPHKDFINFGKTFFSYS